MNRVTRRVGAALLVAGAVAAGAVAAQAQPAMQRGPLPPYPDMAPPIPPGDMANYCVYENRVYSLGSGVCFGRSAFVCVPSQGPATGNRAYWTSKEDTVFGRPSCG
jgi:Protein of unknown function (DUF1496)